MIRLTFLQVAGAAVPGVFAVGGVGRRVGRRAVASRARAAWRTLRNVAASHGYQLDVRRTAWPWSGSMQRFEPPRGAGGPRVLAVTLDRRLSLAEQASALEQLADDAGRMLKSDEVIVCVREAR